MTEWIPVTKALPDADGNYLVTVQEKGVDHREIITSYYHQSTRMILGYWWSIELDHMEVKVLAWMKLPPEYEEDIK